MKNSQRIQKVHLMLRVFCIFVSSLDMRRQHLTVTVCVHKTVWNCALRASSRLQSGCMVHMCGYINSLNHWWDSRAGCRLLLLQAVLCFPHLITFCCFKGGTSSLRLRSLFTPRTTTCTPPQATCDEQARLRGLCTSGEKKSSKCS